jgi:predicted nucleotidyltransferase
LKDSERIFNQLLEDAKKDSNIIGFILGGARGKGFATRHSDYDIYVVVKDKVLESYEEKYEKLGTKDITFWVISFSFFEEYAAIGSPYEYDRYNFTHLRAMIDGNGRIQNLIDENGKLPKEEKFGFVSGKLDSYINSVYRSLKCFRDGNIVGARLEASRSIPLFLNVIFGLIN